MCLNCIMISNHETWWGAKTRYVHKGADRVMGNRANLDNSSGKPLGFQTIFILFNPDIRYDICYMKYKICYMKFDIEFMRCDICYVIYDA